ncbi:hypothetical protein DMS07_28815 [Klebsiella variicola]|nr:hypothetical protein [Klebsiella variicola]PXK63476.1 hypothetical protein DMS07_28815 [Klebsiella variicola]
MRDLILQLSKSSIYSTKPNKALRRINKKHMKSIKRLHEGDVTWKESPLPFHTPSWQRGEMTLSAFQK